MMETISKLMAVWQNGNLVAPKPVHSNIPGLQIVVTRSRRFKRISFIMVSSSSLIVRAPIKATDLRIQRAVVTSRAAIESLKKRFDKKAASAHVTDFTKAIAITGGEIRFVQGEKEGFKITGESAEIFFCKEDSETLHKTIELCLAKLAKKYLVSRCGHISSLYGLPFESVRVKRVRTIWGSCSSKKNINLSVRLMLLNESLVDYVIKHELVHTKHRNHGRQFWAELNKITDGMAKDLDRKLSSHSYPLKDILEKGYAMHVS